MLRHSIRLLLHYLRFGNVAIGEDDRKKGDVHGFDGGKRVKGRRRHTLVDSLGLVLKAVNGSNVNTLMQASSVIIR